MEWAAAVGLRRVWTVSRAQVDAAFADGGPGTPAVLHPGYRSLLLLASPGRMFWEGFRRAVPALESAGPEPLDRYSEQRIEALVQRLHPEDPAALAVYPFHHPRQLLGFGRLLGEPAWAGATPFGLTVDPHFGPWFAWRGAILTALDWPPDPRSAAPACEGCAAPCVAACPSRAVAVAGFDWETCANFRLKAQPCKATCLSRMACPVGAEYRYTDTQMRYHYGASLRMIERWSEGKGGSEGVRPPDAGES